jgi:phospholipase C
MMENSSFDHVFGWFTRGGEFGDDRVDGLYGTECNPKNVRDLSKGYFCVNDKAEDTCDDPDHGYTETTEAIFACHFRYLPWPFDRDNPCRHHDSITGNPTMAGFSDLGRRKHHKGDGSNELTMWNPEKIPITRTLAKEFAFIDRYFASFPGPTDPNRMFVHSGTARGIQSTGECRNQECAS